MHIKLQVGSRSEGRSWAGVNGRWTSTRLGRKFYHEPQDNYIATVPFTGHSSETTAPCTKMRVS